MEKWRPIQYFAARCTKTTELIEMLFGMWTRLQRVGPSKHVLDGVHIRTIWRLWMKWTVCLRRRCGFMWNYCDHLLLYRTELRSELSLLRWAALHFDHWSSTSHIT